MGNLVSRVGMTELTKYRKVENFVKWRVRTESYNGFHLLERMFVVWRKERMWQIMESRKSLILFTDIGIERLEDVGIKARVPERI